MRATRTLFAIALAASEIADRIHVNSPVEPGESASPWRIWDWSDVTLGWSLALRRRSGSGMRATLSRRILTGMKLVAFGVLCLLAVQQSAPAGQVPSRASVLRGEYGRYRANNDVLHYHLDIRIDPDKKTVTGKNTIRFKMLQ